MPRSTVSAILARIGLGKLSALERPEATEPLRASTRGRVAHIDVKKLGRDRIALATVSPAAAGARRRVGWEYVYVCIDDATRLAYVEVLTDERRSTAVGFLRRAARLPTDPHRAGDDR